MKRDVKVGLFVAGIVCCVAALLLGGGVVGGPKTPTAPLSLNPREDAGRRAGALSPRAPGVLPAEFAESVLPPADAERLADEIAELPVEDRAVGDDVLDEALLADAPHEAELPAISSDAAADEHPRQTAADADYAAAIAEAMSLLDEGPSAGGQPAGTGGELAEMDITEEELLALELAVEDAPPEPAGAARNAADVAAEVPSLRIAPPARGTTLRSAYSAEVASATKAGSSLRSTRIAVPAPAKHVYIMKRGDSFWTVSKKVYGAGKYFKNILLANPDIEPKKLRPKDKIAIPEIPGVPMRKDLLADPRELARKRKPRVYLARDRVHVVQPLETLEDIALKYYGYKHKWPHIQGANPDLEPRKIRPGDRIVVPALTE